MKRKAIALAVFAVLSLVATGAAQAQGKARFDTGKAEYESNCVVCHGAGGKGDGSYAELLKKPASDLTVLRKNNGGVFPVDQVYAVIDGRQLVKGHGDRDMPVWGRDYVAATGKAAEYYVDVPYDAEMFARSRILALIDYLNRLQAK
jgi:mono/diheme cytochrome c family protein